LSHVNEKVERADVVERTESNIFASTTVSERIPLRGRRARHDVQCVDSNSGDPHRSSHRGSMAYNATNRGSQTVVRESDTVIVPKTPGNAGIGKDGTQVGPAYGTHFLIHRDRRKKWERN
jgi:hypothetical protein